MAKKIPNINFNLRHPDRKESPIHIIIRWRSSNNKSLTYVGNTDESIRVTEWDKKEQEAKTALQTGKKKLALRKINFNLNSIEAQIEDYFESYIEKHGMTPSKNEVMDFYKLDLKGNGDQEDGPLKEEMTLQLFIEKIMPMKRFTTKEGVKKVTPQTVRNYKQTGRLIKEFGGKYNRVIDFRDINQRFYEDFVTWMQEKPVRGRKENTLDGEDGSNGHTANFIGKTINNLKSIMNYALDQGVIESLPYNPKKFVPPEDDRIEHIHLNIEQLDEMWSLIFTKEEGHLEISRDLFLVSAWTSLRFSDLERFNENARIDKDKKEITIVTQKTGEEVAIPLIPPVPQILEKWNFKLPHMFNQKANKHIKTVACRLKGFDREQTLTRTEGAERQTRKYQLCEMVSTHTARRSFATNFVREFGVNPFTVMKLTGHKSFDVFQNYIKFGSEDVKNEINEKVQLKRNGDSQKVNVHDQKFLNVPHNQYLSHRGLPIP